MPTGLLSLTVGAYFDHSMEKVSLPTGMLSLTVGAYFNQSIEKVSLFTGLLSFTVGAYFDQATATAIPTAYNRRNDSWCKHNRGCDNADSNDDLIQKLTQPHYLLI